jgi:antagonist of KipI
MSIAEPISIRVIKPGFCTTVQDLGRRGFQQYGVSVSGAMDRLALVIANRLVSNQDRAAALEITLNGPELLFEEQSVVAITGADLSPAIDGSSVPLWTTLALRTGSRLTFGTRRNGARAYLSVAGGFDVPSLWDSRSTHLSSCTGGLNGRVLMADDMLPVGIRVPGSEQPHIGATLPDDCRPVYVDRPTLRVIPGPQDVSADALAILTTAPYRLTSQSDRMGYRLEGAPLRYVVSQPPISDGTAMGALQIPPDGSPILLMADRPTTGGYPKVAAVISADLPLAAQLLPDDRVSFLTVTVAEAEAASVKRWRQISEVLPRRRA